MSKGENGKISREFKIVTDSHVSESRARDE